MMISGAKYQLREIVELADSKRGSEAGGASKNWKKKQEN